MKKAFLAGITGILLAGCKTTYIPPNPIQTPIMAGKIGVYLNVSNTFHHTHIGTTIFNNFHKTYGYVWDHKALILDSFRNELAKNGNYTVVDLAEAYPNSKMDDYEFVHIRDKQWVENDFNDPRRKKLVAEGYKAVIRVAESRILAFRHCHQYGCTEFFTEGPGLFTRSLFALDNYFVAPSSILAVETLEPLAEISDMAALHSLKNNQTTEIEEMQDPVDFNNIQQPEIKPIMEHLGFYYQKVASTTKDYLQGKQDG